MNWTRPADLRVQLQKLWERGEMLAELVTGTSTFPRCLMLKVPTSAEMTDRFDGVRVWIGELLTMPHYRVELRDFRHRLFGANAVPHQVWIDSGADALAILGKQRAAARFCGLIEMTRRQQPQLLAWPVLWILILGSVRAKLPMFYIFMAMQMQRFLMKVEHCLLKTILQLMK